MSLNLKTTNAAIFATPSRSTAVVPLGFCGDFVLPALLQKLVSEVFLLFCREFGGNFAGFFIKAQKVRGNLGAFFVRKFVAQNKSFVPKFVLQTCQLKIFLRNLQQNLRSALCDLKAQRVFCNCDLLGCYFLLRPSLSSLRGGGNVRAVQWPCFLGDVHVLALVRLCLFALLYGPCLSYGISGHLSEAGKDPDTVLG